MNGTNHRRMEADDSRSFSVVPTRGLVEAQLEKLKNNLLRRQMRQVTDSKVAQRLAWAANEAAALAWFTNCPMLILPTLLEEKIAVALQWGEKQDRLRRG
jgi:hypothetical protein